MLPFALPSLPLVTAGLLGFAAIAGPLVTYGAMAVREKIAVSAAVSAARVTAESACTLRIDDVERAKRAAVDAAVAEAARARESVEATPEQREAIVALCKRSASCRSRNALNQGAKP